MKLTKISYGSAVYFGVMSLILYLLLGIVQWSLKDTLFVQGVEVTLVSAFVITPVVGAIMGYLIVLLMIAVYNAIAKQYPISWEVGKK